MSDDCIFCKISSGDIPSEIVASDPQHVAIKDIEPKAQVHILVFPREHHAHLDGFVEAGADAGSLLKFATQTAQRLGISGRYRMITNVGPDAGQTVNHLHVHLLSGPRLPGF